ncbi:probable E3 ubiquitin-protein ligase HERC4 [Diadema antillarum]|uniref:probable E3 ubiquitin-protein ligase HERC4 n=1 Tax=Diadema antillarum TaxID=105358 RepID=UPI003A8BEBB4
MASDSKLGKVLQKISHRSRDDTKLTADLHSKLVQALSPSSLSSDFRVSSSSSSSCFADTEDDDQYFDVDLDALREAYHHIADKEHVLKKMAKEIHRVYQDLGTFLCESTNRKDVRLIPILLECPTFDRVEEEWSREIVLDLAKTLLKLNKEDKCKFKLLGEWWYQEPELLARTVRVLLKTLQCEHGPKEYLQLDREDLYLETLNILHAVNGAQSGGKIIPDESFYLQGLESDDVLDKHLDNYFQNKQTTLTYQRQPWVYELFEWPFTLVDFPFLLPVSIKWRIACMEFTVEQVLLAYPACFLDIVEEMMKTGNPFAPFFPGNRMFVPEQIHFEVNREKVVESALENVRSRATGESGKPLEVHFVNDVALGVNGGGPMKEFFQLIFDELLEPGKYPVFKRIKDCAMSTTCWFNKDFHDLDMLKAIGKLFGLMIYNKVIITLPFPDLFYKKIVVDIVSSTKDLQLLEPDMAKSIQSLSQLSEEDLKAMEMTFLVDDSSGETKELKEGGEAVMVTKDNVKEYIELYSRYHTAEKQVQAFKSGFLQVTLMNRFQELFKWEEMRALFLGGEYDWRTFEESFRFEQGYTREHRVIKMFWEVFHSLLEEEKREFLRFFTGATHVPVGGFGVIGPRMWPMGGEKDCRGGSPEDMCPEVNTCQGYVVLHLPMYRRKEHLEFRLRKALNITTGFHKLHIP